jgi:multidrug transporter EmrE-like cation transporter
VRVRGAAVRRPARGGGLEVHAAVVGDHFAYYITLAGAYHRGDLSFAYPLMRGVAPLFVTLLGVLFLGEHPGAKILVGIALISTGIIVIASFAGGRHSPCRRGLGARQRRDHRQLHARRRRRRARER